MARKPVTPTDDEQQKEAAGTVSRRGFLTNIGAGAAGAAGALAIQPADAIAQLAEPPPAMGHGTTRPDRFSRLFNLPPFAQATTTVKNKLLELGQLGGILDARDPLEIGPIRLITEPQLSPNNRDNPGNTAGVTFFGQFLDHDMTFDAASPLGVPTVPGNSPNERTPSFDLDTVYGGGPTASPQLYNSSDRAKLKIEHGGLFEDLPRTSDGTAIIGDPRNDENMMISGLHAAFILFHNRVVDYIRDYGAASLMQGAEAGMPMEETEFEALSSTTFTQARRIVTWHYHWIILNEFLPLIVGSTLMINLLHFGRQFYRPVRGQQSIPVEFQGAVYRFGHSLVRPSYRANLAGNNGGGPFFGFIFDPAGEGQSDPVDLRGGARAPRRFIGWQTFFDFGGAQTTNVRNNKRVDTKISTSLFKLPLGTIPGGAPPISLPQRNLLRHLTWSLPSGQAIANAMGIQPLTTSQLSDFAQFGVGFERNTPLWPYILREADVLANGHRLAGIGGRIVAEVFVGLLQLDNNGYLTVNPNWRPTLPARTPGNFTVVDLLTFAGVDPASRGQ